MSKYPKINQTGPGRPLLYGKPLVEVVVRVVPELAERLEREAQSRIIRDGKSNRWTVGRVAHEDLAGLYGIALDIKDS